MRLWDNISTGNQDELPRIFCQPPKITLIAEHDVRVRDEEGANNHRRLQRAINVFDVAGRMLTSYKCLGCNELPFPIMSTHKHSQLANYVSPEFWRELAESVKVRVIEKTEEMLHLSNKTWTMNALDL